MKKISIIAAAFIILLIIIGVWWARLGGNSSPNTETGNNAPFGSGEGVSDSETNWDSLRAGGGEEIFDEKGIPVTNLFRVSNTPVSGFIVFTRGNQTVLRHVERATGHIYEIILPDNPSLNPLTRRKITNNTIPKVYEAYFKKDGSSVLVRTLRGGTDTQENMLINLNTSTSTDNTYNVSLTVLRGEIGSISIAASDNIVYSTRDSNSVVSTDFKNTNTRTLFSSLFDNWKIKTSNTGVYLQANTASNIPGFVYSLNNNSLTKVLGPLDSLSSEINQRGDRLLYSYSIDNVMRLAVRNIQTKIDTYMSPQTLAEKCAWSPAKLGLYVCGAPIIEMRANEIDTWYMGMTSFDDRIWFYDANREISEILVDPQSLLGLNIDVMKPQISPKEDYFLFINKKDMSLWVLRLSGLE